MRERESEENITFSGSDEAFLILLRFLPLLIDLDPLHLCLQHPVHNIGAISYLFITLLVSMFL